MQILIRAAVSAAAIMISGSAALAASCQKEPTFAAWLDGVRAEARADGVSDRAISAALAGVKFDQSVVNKDRGQGVFTQDFLQFSDRMVAAYRINGGKQKIAKLKSTFDRIEREFGVPAPVLTAFWALETDFGAVMGDGPTLTSLATLAYDCRRPDLFRRQLLAAIKIIDRGDLTVAQMRGPWAGELGQFQFIPEQYYNFGIDEDGDGRVDLLKSSADALASAANYIRSLGWQRGQPWLQEIRVPANLPWDQADLTIKLPLAKWSALGVTLAGGKPLPAKGPDASVLLPMGRNGPAFLAYPNFDVYLQWNNSLVYSTAAAYLATRIAGAGPVNRGSVGDLPSVAEIRETQKLLAAKGYDVGKIDGIIGENTRQAVRAMQIKYGLPADSYPSEALLDKMRGG
jgi:lytic murein transglycosylase